MDSLAPARSVARRPSSRFGGTIPLAVSQTARVSSPGEDIPAADFGCTTGFSAMPVACNSETIIRLLYEEFRNCRGSGEPYFLIWPDPIASGIIYTCTLVRNHLAAIIPFVPTHGIE